MRRIASLGVEAGALPGRRFGALRGPIALAAVVGCATAPPPAAEGPRVSMEPFVVRSAPDPLTGLEGYDAADLFEFGRSSFEAEAYAQAAQLYEKLLAEFPNAALVPLAAYNAGLAYERLEEWPSAVLRFSQALEWAEENGDLHVDAHYNLARAYGKLEDWKQVADTFWAVRQLDVELAPMDELEARVGTGIGLFMQGDVATAEREFLRALDFLEKHPRREFLPSQYFEAQARFYVGEIQARDFEGVGLQPPDEVKDWAAWMGKELERKCEILLQAQNRFIRTIRVGHRGWATAAGFRIGALYERLYEQLMAVPVPPELDDAAASIYREELKARVGVLVRKAIRVYEANQSMAERIGERNEWVERTAAALERMKSLYLASAGRLPEE